MLLYTLLLQFNFYKKMIPSREKKLTNLIEANHQINMSSDHSVSSNNSFKSHLNGKSYYTF